MAMDYGYFEPRELAAVVRSLPPVHSFLKDRYFPTSKVFNTRKVTVEYKDGQNILAPFVSPRKKDGIVDYRNGYSVKEYEPANIAPSRVITTDDLDRKLLGEAQFSGMTPAERAINIASEDLKDLNQQISLREEWMAAQTMLTNGCVMKHYADKADEYQEMEIRFYDEAANPAVYTPAKTWDRSDATLIDDLRDMIKMLTARGLMATDVILGSDVVSQFVKNEEILKYLDNRRVLIGELSPVELPTGAAKFMDLNVYGHKVGIYTYDFEYTDDDGVVKPMIPANKIIVSAPGAGQRAYGKVTHINKNKQAFETVAAERVAKQIADEKNDTFTTVLTSKPIFMPVQKNPWIVADVLA